MKKGKERALIRRGFSKTLNYLNAFVSEKNQEDLHQFRVQIKKIKSLLRLFESGLKHPLLSRDFKPVKKIFRHSGKIREAYIHLQLLRNYNVKAPDFEKKQQQIIGSETSFFIKKNKKYRKAIKLSRKKINKRLKNLNNQTIRRFYSNRLNTIYFILGQRRFDDEMHSCRKKIKDLLYDQKPANKALKKALQLDNDYFDQLQNTIGQWHDTLLAVSLFKDLPDQSVPLPLEMQVQKFKQKIIALSENFRNNIDGEITLQQK